MAEIVPATSAQIANTGTTRPPVCSVTGQVDILPLRFRFSVRQRYLFIIPELRGTAPVRIIQRALIGRNAPVSLLPLQSHLPRRPRSAWGRAAVKGYGRKSTPRWAGRRAYSRMPGCSNDADVTPRNEFRCRCSAGAMPIALRLARRPTDRYRGEGYKDAGRGVYPPVPVREGIRAARQMPGRNVPKSDHGVTGSLRPVPAGAAR